MEVGLVSAFEGFGLHPDDSARHLDGGEHGADAGTVRKQRSQRFTVPLSPPRHAASSPARPDSLDSTSLPFQPPPLPVQTQSLSQSEELYSTPRDDNEDEGDEARDDERTRVAETRREYAGSESSNGSPETPFRPLPVPSHVAAANHYRSHGGQSGHYPRHQPPVFYSSTSHSSMPLSPPSLFNLVPGGSPSFTYHHSFPPPINMSSPTQQHYALPAAGSNGYPPPGFVPPPPPPPSSLPYPNQFGLGVGGVPDLGIAMAMGMTGNGIPTRNNPSPGYPALDADDDEIIETAIVIKSIPFSCPKDQLLGLMTSLQLPAPLAFNYHYDLSVNPSPEPQEPRQDQFRGLAFANFRNGEEARVVVTALNGFEFMGRKLRAEFKKVLKPGEKEAIERNKALKRIRSVQLLANGANGGGGGGGRRNGWANGSTGGGMNGSTIRAGAGRNGNGNGNDWNRREPAAFGGFGGYRSYEPDETSTRTEEHVGRLAHNHSRSLLDMRGLSPSSASATGSNKATLFGQREYVVPSGVGMAYGDSGESLIGGSTSADMSGSGSASGASSLMSSHAGTGGPGGTFSGSGSDSEEGVGSSVSAREERKKDLDLNDPQTLQLYSQLLLFSSSPSPPNPTATEFEGMTPLERKKVKLVANMLGLGYGSEDAGAGCKRVRVWKTGSQPALRATSSAAPLRRHASTSSFQSTPTASSSFTPPPVPALPAFSAYLAAPNSGGLRGKKSMPEFRPSGSSSSFYAHDAPPMPTSSPGAYSRPPLNGFSRKSTNNLRSESPSYYNTAPSYGSPSTRRVRETASVQGLFQQHGIMTDVHPSPGSEERREFYSSGLGSLGGAGAVRQPRGPGSGDVSPARANGDGGMEWRSRRS